ncbi:TPA: hypothetical protein DCW56_00355, partial [Candidatus Peregrinibacteria bacterium]|nr:hypothetical protein [Candidatus Peregrinibacteria bacterium]
MLSEFTINVESRGNLLTRLIRLHHLVHLVFGVCLVRKSEQLPLVRLFLFVCDEAEMAEVVMRLAEMGDVVGVVFVVEGESFSVVKFYCGFVAVRMG